MTKQIKNIFKITASFLLTALFTFSISVIAQNGRLPDAELDLTNQPVPIDTTSLPIYFSYGSLQSDSDILDAVGNLSFDGDDFDFVVTGFADIYNGNAERPDTESRPNQAVCNSSTSSPVYPISSSLGSASGLTYGLQSARSTGTPSGTATAGTIALSTRPPFNGLRQEHTGCIRAELRVSSSAEVGSTTRVIFDQDFNASESWLTRPPRQVYIFQIGPAQGDDGSSSDGNSDSDSDSDSNSDGGSDSNSDSNSDSTDNPPDGNSSDDNSNPTSNPTTGGGGNNSTPTTGGGTSTPTGTFDDPTPRTGGVALTSLASVLGVGIIGFIIYKVKSKDITKIDVK
jgi:hypothetical protein